MELGKDFQITEMSGLIYVSLVKTGPKSLKPSNVMDYPHARINPNHIWNEGTKQEIKFLALEWLQTDGKFYGKGYGRKLVKAVVAYMQQSNIELMAFNNFAAGFWDTMRREFPDNILFKKNRKRIGFLSTKGKTDLPF